MTDQTATMAMQSFEREARFRMTVQRVVARTMQEFGPVDPERADADAHDIALRSAALLFQHIYNDDAELNRLKDERDMYRKLAEENMHLRPLAPLVMTR